MRHFVINVKYHADTGVYVATSEGIPGLTLETGTVSALVKAINDVVPRLLTHNLKIPAEQLSNVEIDVLLPPERPLRSNIPHPVNKLGLNLASIAA